MFPKQRGGEHPNLPFPPAEDTEIGVNLVHRPYRKGPYGRRVRQHFVRRFAKKILKQNAVSLPLINQDFLSNLRVFHAARIDPEKPSVEKFQPETRRFLRSADGRYGHHDHAFAQNLVVRETAMLRLPVQTHRIGDWFDGDVDAFGRLDGEDSVAMEFDDLECIRLISHDALLVETLRSETARRHHSPAVSHG